MGVRRVEIALGAICLVLRANRLVPTYSRLCLAIRLGGKPRDKALSGTSVGKSDYFLD